MSAALEAAVERLTLDVEVQVRGELLLVVTGAGVSLASGIPTFRGSDPGAVWKRDVTELGTRRYFEEDPVGSWRWYLSTPEGAAGHEARFARRVPRAPRRARSPYAHSCVPARSPGAPHFVGTPSIAARFARHDRSRFSAVRGARPNPAHEALVELERWQADRGQFLLATQNIDGLHRAAGSVRLVEVHGRADRARCSREGCEHAAPRGSLPRDEAVEEAFDRDPCEATLPRCPACRAPLRQHVLWFDEYYQEHEDYGFARLVRAAGLATAVWFVGTSMAVGVTDLVLRDALRRGAPVALLDPSPPQGLPRGVDVFAVRAEEALPEAARRVGASSGA